MAEFAGFASSAGGASSGHGSWCPGKCSIYIDSSPSASAATLPMEGLVTSLYGGTIGVIGRGREDSGGGSRLDTLPLLPPPAVPRAFCGNSPGRRGESVMDLLPLLPLLPSPAVAP
jgi:hypothetical protein